MEPLWSPVVATGSNQPQIDRTRKRRKQAKSIAVGCDRLPKGAHGKVDVVRPPLLAKEGVDLLAPQKSQVLRTRRPTGLDEATLTGEGLSSTESKRRDAR